MTEDDAMKLRILYKQRADIQVRLAGAHSLVTSYEALLVGANEVIERIQNRNPTSEPGGFDPWTAYLNGEAH